MKKTTAYCDCMECGPGFTDSTRKKIARQEAKKMIEEYHKTEVKGVYEEIMSSNWKTWSIWMMGLYGRL